jgi:hypothetical protein
MRMIRRKTIGEKDRADRYRSAITLNIIEALEARATSRAEERWYATTHSALPIMYRAMQIIWTERPRTIREDSHG